MALGGIVTFLGLAVVVRHMMCCILSQRSLAKFQNEDGFTLTRQRCSAK
ncbi:hypothetical protein CP98_05304 [Sphingobium yanoikuyae]|uniref:Uncharacterized protein n=1 Tax=Sphingobium yanoikuyae TaxID=13690 RepID=A0A084E1Y6_SPHYA|nr:hypothetical protein CP98_05304 [Sphingobium yanoikuyae]